MWEKAKDDQYNQCYCDDDWQKGAHKVMEHAVALNVAKMYNI